VVRLPGRPHRWRAPAPPRLPRSAVLYRCRVTHARVHPLRNVFAYSTYLWLADVDELPRLGPLASFRPGDHVGDPRRPIRENVQEVLARGGISLHGGRILMLAQARVFGYVFNPLTVYWCYHRDGDLACVLAEVHNTYQQRHCYLLRTDARGRAVAAKRFYVSPFYPVDGYYRMSLPEPGPRLALSVVLHRPDGHLFAASVRGHALAPTPGALAVAVARHPWPTAAVSARIRWQGVRLYARGLRTCPRPEHPTEEITCSAQPLP
jgi:DUF1365 family protein